MGKLEKETDKILDVLKDLRKFIEGKESDDHHHDCDSPNIADAALAIEHKRYQLSQIINKYSYLAIVNINKLQELNLYNFFGGILDNDEDIADKINEMKKANDQFLETIEKMAKEFKKEKKESDDE
jgi:hypothetical protein